jgi:hypothetical protein
MLAFKLFFYKDEVGDRARSNENMQLNIKFNIIILTTVVSPRCYK